MIFKPFVITLLSLFFLKASHGLEVLTTTTELAFLAQEIGREKVHVRSLLSGREDPHHIDVMPSFIRRAMKADLICFVGLGLEDSWILPVIKKSGNLKVQRGSPGFLEVGPHIHVIGKVEGKVDRSAGHVHAGGNPHFHLSPIELISAAKVISKKLGEIDPLHRDHYELGFKELSAKLKETQKKVSEILKKIPQKKVMEYHQEWAYFSRSYGLKDFGAVEEVPGALPSGARLKRVASYAKENHVNLILANPLAPKKLLEKLQKMSEIPVLSLPSSFIPEDFPKGFESYQVHLATEIIKAIHGDPETTSQL